MYEVLDWLASNFSPNSLELLGYSVCDVIIKNLQPKPKMNGGV